MTTNTKPDLDTIRKRADAATEGPWEIHDRYIRGDRGAYTVADFTVSAVLSDDEKTANATFIANARADIPALLDHIATLTAERDAAREDAIEEMCQRAEEYGYLSVEDIRALKEQTNG